MDEKCFPFWILSTSERLPDGTIENRGDFSDTSSEAEDAIDVLLEKWGMNAFDFFTNCDGFSRQSGRWPWAVALYEKELRLAGHALSIIRKINRKDFNYSSYSCIKTGMSSEDYIRNYGVPAFSFLYIYNKAALEKAAEFSPLFDQAWSLLKYKDEDNHWVCLPPSPSDEWVVKTSAGDDVLFSQMRATQT